jgi:acyl-CoA synthetase (AMP-forming)/AMP-acid ligase II
MNRWMTAITLVAAGTCMVGCGTNGGGLGGVLDQMRPLDNPTIVAGLKQALEVGTGNAVTQTSAAGGFWNDLAIRILIPEKLQSLAKTLRTVGMGSHVDAFEKKMNDAAEAAAVHAKPIFFDAIREMTFADARGILTGGDTAATDYFRGKTSTKLASLFKPIVKEKMSELGVMKSYDDLLGKVPLGLKPSFSVEQYVTDQGLKGLFKVVGDEEKKIRQNPAARVTDLLRRVFGRT